MAVTDVTTPLGVIHIDIDPVFFHLGPLSVHWYGIMYAVAFLVAFRYGVLPHLRARGLAPAKIERLTAWTILAGLLGARLYYVVQQPLADYSNRPFKIFAVWEGGMAFFGAIFAGLGAIWYLARKHRLSFWLLADAGVLFACIGQPIGRIGNIVNGDILGPESRLPWATAYFHHVNASQCAVLQSNASCGVGYQPAAAYEALGTLVILGILLLLRRRQVRDGILAITYVGAYAVSQLILFQFRSSEPTVFRGLKQAQITALLVLAVGVPALVAAWRRSPEASAPPAPPVPAGLEKPPVPTRRKIAAAPAGATAATPSGSASAAKPRRVRPAAGAGTSTALPPVKPIRPPARKPKPDP